ncbi:MAG: hypothetical protein WC928_02670 [Patescibacteria group bacterium]|jgi:hypothetical protein
MQIAPVLLSVYNRPKHFRNCVESLKENELASQTHLFVAIDAPYRPEDELPNSEVIEYAKQISGFKEVTLFIRCVNLGSKNNAILAYEEVFKKYDRVIRSEDDNVFSRDFLYFMNQALTLYEERDDINFICGYNTPLQNPEKYTEQFYKSVYFRAWGTGVWRDKREMLILRNRTRALGEIRSFLKNYKEVFRYHKVSNNLILNLIYMLKKNHLDTDGYISLFQFLNKTYSVFPIISRTKNMGHDGSGINCRKKQKNKNYEEQKIYSGDINYELPAEIKENPERDEEVALFLKRGIIKNVYTFVLLVLVNWGLLYRKK